MNESPASQRGFLEFLGRLVITTIAVLVASQIVPGIGYQTQTGLFVAALLLGILNAIVRPFLLLLSLPLLFVTLGLFTLVINALLLSLVGYLVQDFHVDGFWSAFFGALIISVVSVVLNSLTGTGNARLRVQRRRRPPPDRPPDPGGGPVIDI